MIEESLYRITSLVVVMIAVFLGWYKFKLVRLKEKDAEEQEIKTQARQEAIRYSIVIGVIFMVTVLGISGHLL